MRFRVSCFALVLPVLLFACDKGFEDASGVNEKAEALIDDGNPKEAIDLLSTVLEEHPHEVDLRLTLARAYNADGRFGEAVDELDKACESDPDDPRGPFMLGRLYLTGKQWDYAAKYFQQALDKGMNEKSVSMDMGQALGQLRRYDEAIGWFERAMEAGVEPIVARFNRGVAYDASRKFKEAKEDFEMVLRERPDYVVGLNVFSTFLFSCEDESLRDYPRAVKLAEKLCELEIHPDHYRTLGLAHQANGEPDKGAQALIKALELNPMGAYHFQKLLAELQSEAEAK